MNSRGHVVCQERLSRFLRALPGRYCKLGDQIAPSSFIEPSTKPQLNTPQKSMA